MAAVIRAIFKCDGQESEVVNVNYSLDQNIDQIGQPAGEVRGGIINVTVMSSKSEKRFGWMVASDVKKSGEIAYVDKDGQTMKTLKFEDAYCVGYNESFTAFDGQASGNVTVKDGAKEKLTLSCKSIKMEGETHENSWETI